MKNTVKIKTGLLGLSMLFLGIFSAATVQAHNSLSQSAPANGAVLHEAPAAISLSFNDATYLTALEVKNADGMNVLVDFAPAIQSANTFSRDLPENLASGIYTVNWIVVGDDTHEIKGEFSFTVNAMSAEHAGMNHGPSEQQDAQHTH